MQMCGHTSLSNEYRVKCYSYQIDSPASEESTCFRRPRYAQLNYKLEAVGKPNAVT